MEVFVQLLRFCSLLPAIVTASGALAADADNGKRLAEMRCVTCHIVPPSDRRVVTDAPPFEATAKGAGRRRLHQHACKVVDVPSGLGGVLSRARPNSSDRMDWRPLSKASSLRLRALRRRSETDDGFAIETGKGVELGTLLVPICCSALQSHRAGSAESAIAAERALGPQPRRLFAQPARVQVSPIQRGGKNAKSSGDKRDHDDVCWHQTAPSVLCEGA